MNPSPPRPTYHPARIALHWLTLLLLVAVFATIEARVLFVKGTPERDLMKTLHFMLGVSVLLPVGGIAPASLAPYVAAGAAGFGLGSALFTPAMADDEVSERAAAFCGAWAALAR